MYQVQGSSCASLLQYAPRVYSLFFSFSRPKLLCGQQRPGLVVIAPRVFHLVALGAYHSYRSLLRGSPLYLRRCRQTTHPSYFMIPSWIKCFHQPVSSPVDIVVQALSPRSISHHVRSYGTLIPKIASKSSSPAEHRTHVLLP